MHTGQGDIQVHWQAQHLRHQQSPCPMVQWEQAWIERPSEVRTQGTVRTGSQEAVTGSWGQACRLSSHRGSSKDLSRCSSKSRLQN